MFRTGLILSHMLLRWRRYRSWPVISVSTDDVVKQRLARMRPFDFEAAPVMMPCIILVSLAVPPLLLFFTLRPAFALCSTLRGNWYLLQSLITKICVCKEVLRVAATKVITGKLWLARMRIWAVCIGYPSLIWMQAAVWYRYNQYWGTITPVICKSRDVAPLSPLALHKKVQLIWFRFVDEL